MRNWGMSAGIIKIVYSETFFLNIFKNRSGTGWSCWVNLFLLQIKKFIVQVGYFSLGYQVGPILPCGGG